MQRPALKRSSLRGDTIIPSITLSNDHTDKPQLRHDSPLDQHSPILTTSMARPRVLGIHHLKFAVSDLSLSLAWYSRVLGGTHLPALDHTCSAGKRYAAVLEMPDWQGLYLELRVTSTYRPQRGWDPVTLSVQGKKELEEWVRWLEVCATVHSPLLVGRRGWILVFEDPDGRRFRIFTREKHDGREKSSEDNPWLREAS